MSHYGNTGQLQGTAHTEDTLIVAKERHVCGAGDGDPEGQPSSCQAEVIARLDGAKETHGGGDSVNLSTQSRCNLMNMTIPIPGGELPQESKPWALWTA